MVQPKPDLVAELDADEAELLARLADTLTPVTPDAALRAALLAKASGPGRLHRFAEAVAAMVDVSVDKARELLDRVADATRWERDLFPGMDALWVEGGPAAANCIRGFARLDAGAAFPDHEHIGDEATLVLEGVMLESGGAVVRPGETIVMRAGTAHNYRAAPDGPDLLFFVVAKTAIGFPGGPALNARD